MATLTDAEVSALLRPYVADCNEDVIARLGIYLDLLVRWNERMNLTAIRDPREIVRRHFGESLFAAAHLGGPGTLLDFGSGAGFPGVPIALVHPGMSVTLAESQGKKAAFLREVVRALGLSVEVWGGRVEKMPGAMVFDCVVMRAVDGMNGALGHAWDRAAGSLVVLTTSLGEGALVVGDGFEEVERLSLPESTGRYLLRYGRSSPSSVPRGTSM